MKKLIVTVALLLMAALPLMAERVTHETARKVAATFLNNNGAKATQLTDLSKAAGFPNLYIFTTEQGFVVMAADDCVKPILGYSLTSKFVTENMPENLRWWLQGYSDQIQDAIESKTTATTETAQLWRDLTNGKSGTTKANVVVAPLIQTRWDQGSPYNMYCPTGTVTGCVATAMAQVMKFWNYPEQGQGSHSYTPGRHPGYGEQIAYFGDTIYDWDNMVDHYKYYYDEGGTLHWDNTQTVTQKKAVATLMYHCGVSVDMDYGTSDEGGSSAASSKVPSALVEYFRYAPSASFVSKASFTEDEWIAFLQSELNERRPLLYSGSYINSENQQGGHAFVCDGYRSDNFFHFNWGWSGSDGDGTNNGYWEIGALNPLSGGIGSGHGTYNLNNAVAAWVEPISTLTAPTLSATSANGIITLSWNLIEEADSYDIYKDNVKIATGITDNNYIDNDMVSGKHYQYYIRAISGETRSNPSNRVTKTSYYRDYSVSGLTVTHANNNVSLTWAAPANNTASLQYATGYSGSRYGMGEGKDTYWAEVFSPSRIASFEGMYIEKVSAYIYLTGNYTLMIYHDNTEDESNKLCEESFSISNISYGWKDIELSIPVLLDCSKELWVVLFYPYSEGSSQTFWYPATSGNYDEIQFDNEEDEEKYNPRLIGESLDHWYHVGANISWLFRTYLTDGTYTYNIYDNGEPVTSNVSETSYIVTNPSANTVHKYTATTNYYGGESAASNIASLTLGTASIEALHLGDNDKMTITENSKLTVSDTLSNTNPANLILEDGAQLIHNSANVKATVKKNIVPYSSNENGWNFIASPVTENVTPSDNNGLTTNTFDLFRFNQSAAREWENYKVHNTTETPFYLINGQGYLYANSGNPTLSFAGTLVADSIQQIPLSYANNVTFKGFNLVGNPYPCNASVNKDFFVISGNSVVMLASNAREIAPCEGVFVKATDNKQSVTFTKVNPKTRSNQSNNCIDFVISQNRSTLDRARVRFGEGTNMEKFTLDQDNTQISLWQNGQEYAVAYSEGKDEMPINFKASENGIYTLSIENEQLELDYLHLIDNLTGNDIDLLAMPNYTFEARTTDYASRFRLAFASNCGDAVGDNEVFAYVSNGEIVINQEEATLQIVDMMGRIIISRCGDVSGNVSTAEMIPGVYVLRLVKDDMVKTQKIVIE